MTDTRPLEERAREAATTGLTRDQYQRSEAQKVEASFAALDRVRREQGAEGQSISRTLSALDQLEALLAAAPTASGSEAEGTLGALRLEEEGTLEA